MLDVKRENWSTSAGYRQRAGQSVYLFDPLDPEGRTARYNPLAHIRRADDTEVVNELQKIAVMLFPAPERSDPFWAEAARAAFIGVGALVAANPGMPFTIGEITSTAHHWGSQERSSQGPGRGEGDGTAPKSGMRLGNPGFRLGFG